MKTETTSINIDDDFGDTIDLIAYDDGSIGISINADKSKHDPHDGSLIESIHEEYNVLLESTEQIDKLFKFILKVKGSAFVNAIYGDLND